MERNIASSLFPLQGGKWLFRVLTCKANAIWCFFPIMDNVKICLTCMQEAGKPHVYESSLVDQLNKRGIAVAGIDLQGSPSSVFAHASSIKMISIDKVRWNRLIQICNLTAGCGFSEGMRCYIDRYEDYVEDIQDFIKWALKQSSHSVTSQLSLLQARQPSMLKHSKYKVQTPMCTPPRSNLELEFDQSYI